MDISEQYIKMCDCQEIQEYLHYELGDFIARPLSGDGKAIIVVGYNNQSYLRSQFQELKYIWLSRQDQIQEMMGHEDLVKLMDDFLEFYERRVWTISKIRGKRQAPWVQEKGARAVAFASMEQLWLAFYMWEKHGKTWDGKKWKGTSPGGKEGE